MSLASMMFSYLTLAIGNSYVLHLLVFLSLFCSLCLQLCGEIINSIWVWFLGLGGVTISFLKRHLLSSIERESL